MNSQALTHVPVMANEALAALRPVAGGTYLDCTAGGGGHSALIASSIGTDGLLISIDRDDWAVKATEAKLGHAPCAHVAVKADFRDAAAVLDGQSVVAVDGVLYDLGVSSPQLDDPTRGFSYRQDAALDMRMDQTSGRTAADIVNGYSLDDLMGMFREFGQGKHARRVAEAIVARRPFATTLELAETIKHAIPKADIRPGKHPARAYFHALRSETNGELSALDESLDALRDRIKKGGRVVVITYHSLEDGLVKRKFADWSKPKLPKEVPLMPPPADFSIVKAPRHPSEREAEENRRSRSARIRAVQRN